MPCYVYKPEVLCIVRNVGGTSLNSHRELKLKAPKVGRHKVSAAADDAGNCPPDRLVMLKPLPKRCMRILPSDSTPCLAPLSFS
jgi:hypothetical protein